MPAGDAALLEPAELLDLEAAGATEDSTRRTAQAGHGKLAAAIAALWPRLLAIAAIFALWQIVVWAGWRPDYVLPGPWPVLQRLVHDLGTGDLLQATATTLERAAIGFGVATLIGGTVGLVMARVQVVRVACRSLVSGIQSMPSVAWFPLAILLFQLSESAILFVVVLGAAPAIATGVVAGVESVPPQVLRAGRALGARGPRLIFHVLLPAALPGIVSGLKQGWAFAWRSLMAGELLVVIGHRPSLGVRLEYARQFADAKGLLSTMIVVLLIGVFIDAIVFARIEHTLRSHRGLIEQSS